MCTDQHMKVCGCNSLFFLCSKKVLEWGKKYSRLRVKSIKVITQAKRMVKLSIIMVMEVLYRYIIDNM